MKRLSDIFISAVGLLVLSPLFALIAMWVKFYDWGPVLYCQERVGQGGHPFRMLKFRSMVLHADRIASLTVGADARITPVGRWLRRYKIDELPQLWNVLRGEMSLVGPRPEISKFVDAYSLAQKEVLRLKPGITDPSSFALYDESSLLATKADPERFYRDHLMGEKIRVNLDYAAKASFATDMLLIFATVGRMVGLKMDVFAHLKIESPKTSF